MVHSHLLLRMLSLYQRKISRKPIVSITFFKTIHTHTHTHTCTQTHTQWQIDVVKFGTHTHPPVHLPAQFSSFPCIFSEKFGKSWIWRCTHTHTRTHMKRKSSNLAQVWKHHKAVSTDPLREDSKRKGKLNVNAGTVHSVKTCHQRPVRVRLH